LNDHLSPITLAFSDNNLEKEYLEEYRKSSIKIVLSFLPWAVFTAAFGILVFVSVLPDIPYLNVFITFAICLFLAIYLKFRFFPPSCRLIEIDFILIAVLPGWLYSSGLLVGQSPFEKYVYALIAVHIVSSSLAMPVRFVTAMIGQVLMIWGFYFALILSNLSIGDAILQSLFLNGIISFCFGAVYQREKALRENFLKQKTITSYSKAFQTELEKGRKIQKDFLPTQIPQFQNCDIATYFHPALQLSGDFYDVFTLPSNRVGLVIADVSDKGVGSALFMALVRSLIRFISGHSQLHCSFDNQCEENPIALKDLSESNVSDPVDALDAVSLTNEYIAHEHGEEGMFATLFFGVIDPSTGLLSYINGGHEPLIIVGADGIKKRLKPTGPAVGMMPGSNYTIGEAQLDRGDILFGYTDGVTEARSPADELYTRKRLEKSVENSTRTTATDFSENVKSDLFKFIEQAPQSDDITMLTVRWAK